MSSQPFQIPYPIINNLRERLFVSSTTSKNLLYIHFVIFKFIIHTYIYTSWYLCVPSWRYSKVSSIFKRIIYQARSSSLLDLVFNVYCSSDRRTIVKNSPSLKEDAYITEKASINSFKSDTIYISFSYYCVHWWTNERLSMDVDSIGVVSISIRPVSSVRGSLRGNFRLVPVPQVYEVAPISHIYQPFPRKSCPLSPHSSQNRTRVARTNDKVGVVFRLLPVRWSPRFVENKGPIATFHHDDSTILNNWRWGKRRPDRRTNRCTRRSTRDPMDFDRLPRLKHK